MSSVIKVPSDIPSLEDGIDQRPESLHERIQNIFLERTRLNASRSGNLIK